MLEFAKPEAGDSLFHARIDSLWSGQRLIKAEVVIDEFLVMERKRGGQYVLNKCGALTGGQNVISDGSQQDRALKRSRLAAVLSLYKRMANRVALVSMHPDVAAGRVSEGAAMLEGLL